MDRVEGGDAITVLDHGIHFAVPFEVYANDPGLNQSLFDCETPAHLLHAMSSHEDTSSYRKGRALHCAVLEPDQFWKRYIVRPKFTGKGAHAAADEWEEEHKDWDILTPKEMDAVHGMAAGIRRNPETKRLVEMGHGHEEATCIWIDPQTGVRCKARIDRFVPGVLALDVKTAASATPQAIAWAFTTERGGYGYARQFAWYRRGLLACGQVDTPWSVVVVENVAPYEAVAYTPEPDFLKLGETDANAALHRIAGWLRANEWNGYPRTIQTLHVPDAVRHRRRSEIGE